MSNWPDPGGQIMHMTQTYSLLPHKGNSPRKTKHSKITQICSNYTVSTFLLSTMMTYVKNMSNQPDPGDHIMDMTENYSLLPHKGNFPGKSESSKSPRIYLEYKYFSFINLV